MPEGIRALAQAATAVKIGATAGKILAWLLAACCLVAVSPLALAQTGYRLEPIPQSEPLPPISAGQPDGHAAPEGNVPAVGRPIVQIYSTAGCLPCVQAEQALREAGIPIYVPLTPPAWVDSFPTLAWQGESGAWHYQYGWSGLAPFLAGYGPYSAASAASVSAPASAAPLEQAHRFLGDAGTFAISPATPVTAMLQDGSVVHYSRLTGRWKATADTMAITLDAPLPAVTVHYWGIAIAANILGANADAKTITIRTSKGTHRVKVMLEPAARSDSMPGGAP